jgi:hypothetical protein
MVYVQTGVGPGQRKIWYKVYVVYSLGRPEMFYTPLHSSPVSLNDDIIMEVSVSCLTFLMQMKI